MLETIILGAGPAGTGPLVWAAGADVLDAWLDRGIAIVDQRTGFGGTIGRYALNADTLGATFLECLRNGTRHRCLAAMDADAATQALEAYHDGWPPLTLVGRYLDRLGAMLAAEVVRHERSRVLTQTRVVALRLGRDGSVTAELRASDGRRPLLRAASAVLALGGYQPYTWRACEILPGILLSDWRNKIVPSDPLLAAGGSTLAAVRLAGRARPRVVVLGGSHSAFAVAWVLLERTPGVRFQPGAVQILYRSPPRPFYASRGEAVADGYRFAEADVCPSTGRVHRLGGLRGDGRELWRRLCGRGAPHENRATARPIGAMTAEELRGILDAADLIVPAFGYRLRTVPVFDAEGRRVHLARTGAAVDAAARLITETGEALPNVFGIGLGSGFRPWGDMAGEPSFRGQQNSLWLYQHGLGAMIYRGVRQWAEERRERVARTARQKRRFCHPLDTAALLGPPDWSSAARHMPADLDPAAAS